ncbi:hypothetical protein TRVL_05253 [Trypanosoma vivax]|nr:hypothetical protein TRVL_05253 [Trypanosoma vivax]
MVFAASLTSAGALWLSTPPLRLHPAAPAGLRVAFSARILLCFVAFPASHSEQNAEIARGSPGHSSKNTTARPVPARVGCVHPRAVLQRAFLPAERKTAYISCGHTINAVAMLLARTPRGCPLSPPCAIFQSPPAAQRGLALREPTRAPCHMKFHCVVFAAKYVTRY